ncbi:MAG: FAD-dependent monooxygenase [Ectothiorhodospiraceae bacterium]|nr:FAD-dependent monooxygenase [Ectothiorhodospiraceae bacterium]
MRIAICGAGVGGAIVAHLLRDEPGVEVTCLEQVTADDHSHAGTGLNVGPNALKILAEADPELVDALKAPGVSLPWRNWRTTLTDGTELMKLPLERVADNEGMRIRWSELYRQLRAPVLDRILFNQQVVSMGYEGSEPGATISIGYQDRATGEERWLEGVDLLIGGDGRYSAVREQFLGRPEPRHLGVVIYRLLVPDTADGLIDDYAQWFNGPNRLLAFRVPGEAIYIAGAFPIPPGAPIADDAKSAEVLRGLYAPAKAAPSRDAAFLIDAICDHVDDIHWARVQEIPPAFADERGRVLLLGDASHAMVPTLGQGATMAVEDACAYADCIRAALRGSGGRPLDVPALTARVAQRRMERVRFVVDFSREASDTMLPGSDAVRDTRAKMEQPFLASLRQVYTGTPALETFGPGAARRRQVG